MSCFFYHWQCLTGSAVIVMCNSKILNSGTCISKATIWDPEMRRRPLSAWNATWLSRAPEAYAIITGRFWFSFELGAHKSLILTRFFFTNLLFHTNQLLLFHTSDTDIIAKTKWNYATSAEKYCFIVNGIITWSCTIGQRWEWCDLIFLQRCGLWKRSNSEPLLLLPKQLLYQ